jgi:hypothetical protein
MATDDSDDFFSEVNRPLGPGMPEESAGLAPSGRRVLIGTGVRGVNDRWARLVEGFRPTEYELVVLAKHYLEEDSDITFMDRFYGMSGSTECRMSEFSRRRLATIEEALGAGKFEAAIAKKLAECQKRFADGEKEEQEIESMAPCTKCGTKPYLEGPMLVGSTDETGLCSACIAEEVPKRPCTPCTVCGAERDVASIGYTGDLCRGCAREALAPCANCGRQRGVTNNTNTKDLCWDCASERLAPCKYCGAKRIPCFSSENDHGYCHECTW